MSYATDVADALMVETSIPPELAKLYALLVLTKGDDTTLRDVHDAWALWAGEHRSAVPFDDLTAEVQELDRPYMDAIHRADKKIRNAS